LEKGQNPPISWDDFVMQCEGVLSEEQVQGIRLLTDPLLAQESALKPLLQWASSEIQLRNALARARQGHWGSEARVTEQMHSGWNVRISRVAAEAVSRTNPLETEQMLDDLRWELAEDLALSDPYGYAAIVSWGIRLQIAIRWASLETEAGMQRLEELIDQKDNESWQQTQEK